MLEKIKIENKKLFFIIFGIHFLIAIISTIFYTYNSIMFYETINHPQTLPLNLKIAEIISIIFIAPLTFLYKLIPFKSAIIPLIIFLLMILNSLLISYILVLIYEKFRDIKKIK